MTINDILTPIGTKYQIFMYRKFFGQRDGYIGLCGSVITKIMWCEVVDVHELVIDVVDDRVDVMDQCRTCFYQVDLFD